MPIDVVELLSTLVRIDSANTHPLAATPPARQPEAGMCGFLETLLAAELGFETHRQLAAPGRPNLVAVRETHPGTPFLAFEAHMDTVGTAGMEIAPLTPVIRDGRLYGRGSCDTKGGMAAMLAAVSRLVADGAPPNLMFIASCSEETGCEGAPFIDLTPWEVWGIVAAEPTCNRPVIGHKTQAVLGFECSGTAAHGSRPEAGCNAIYRMAEVVRLLRGVVVPRLAAERAPGFAGGATLSVGTINGGSKVNIVPDRCRIAADVRLLPGGPTPERLAADLARELSDLAGFEVTVKVLHVSPGLSQDPDSDLVRCARAAVRAAGLDDTPGTVSYCTDAGVFAGKGYASLVLGPGDILNAHGAVEYLEIEQVCAAVEIYRHIGSEAGALTSPTAAC